MANGKASKNAFDPVHPGQPMVIEWKKDEIQRALKQATDLFGAQAAAANFNKKHPSRPTDGTSLKKDKMRVGSEDPDDLSVAAKFKYCQRDTLCVVAKQGCRNAYDVLLRLVHLLETPESLRAHGHGDVNNPGDHTKLVRLACERFSELVGADCTVAYYWDRQINRTRVLFNTARYPECMEGLSFVNDLPRHELFNDTSSPVDVIDASPQALGPRGIQLGTFRQREGIETTWVARVRWERGRLAIFWNWRAGSTPKIRPPQSEHRSSNPNPPPAVERALEPRDLCPAVRQFAGYLSSLRLAVNERMPGPTWPACTTITDLWNIVQDQDNTTLTSGFDPTKERMARSLVELIKRLVLAELPTQANVDVRCGFHWTDWTSSGSNVTTLLLRRPKSPTGEGGKSVDLNLSSRVANRGGQVEPGQSITYQSAVWNAPILIPDMNQGPNAQYWRERNLPQAAPFVSNSQMAVPIKDSKGKLIGVINVEANRSNYLSRECLRAVQMVGSIFGRLLEVKHDQRSSGVADFVNVALADAGGGMNLDYFSWRFCDHILTKSSLKPDQVYLLTYDTNSRHFRPRAVRCSKGHYEAIWTSATKKNVPRDVTEYADLLDAAVVHRLIPKRRGRTSTAFATVEPEVVWPTTQEQPPTSQYTRDHFYAAIGVPFRSDVSAQPDGVLWLRWHNDPCGLHDDPDELMGGVQTGAARTPADDPKFDSETRAKIKQQIKENVVKELEPIMGVAASIYALIRVFELTRMPTA
jgi:hypothetical protein